LFETFASVIPFQQVSLDAGIAVVSRLVERFGLSLEHDGRCYHAFPSAQRIAAARLPTLRACGLSLQKAESLRAVARSIATGVLSEPMLAEQSTADALRTLIELPGIGPWSANLVLLRGLGRLDAFPPGDRGATVALQSMLQLSTARELAAVVDKLGDERGLLYFCVLGSKLLERGFIQPA
jgi:DNA-3-methyladenine glycosylase II